MASGIPQDETAAISIALEGILYGEYRNWNDLFHTNQYSVLQGFHSSCLLVLSGR